MSARQIKRRRTQRFGWLGAAVLDANATTLDSQGVSAPDRRIYLNPLPPQQQGLYPLRQAGIGKQCAKQDGPIHLWQVYEPQR